MPNESSSILEVQLHHKILHLRKIAILMELEGLLIELPNILTLRHLLQVLLKLHQLVILTTVIRQNRDAVLQLEYIGIWCIIHQHHAREISVDDPKVLCIDVLVYFHAVFAIETMLYVLPLWVQFIQHHVCVGLVAGSEGYDLVVFRHPLEETYGVWADGNEGLCCRPVFYLDRKHDVVRFCWILFTVNDGLINIQD